MLENAMIGSGVPRRYLRLVDMQGGTTCWLVDLVWGTSGRMTFCPEVQGPDDERIASADGLGTSRRLE